jgi:hypothetical protein
MDIGTAGDRNAFCTDCGITDNDTTDNSDADDTEAVNTFRVYPAGLSVVVTGTDGGGTPANCVSLVVDVYAHCMTVTAATADL